MSYISSDTRILIYEHTGILIYEHTRLPVLFYTYTLNLVMIVYHLRRVLFEYIETLIIWSITLYPITWNPNVYMRGR